MDPSELVTVYTIKNPAQAEVIKNALETEGIACHLDGESQAGLTGIFDIDVLVRASDAGRARELIKAHEPIETHDESEEYEPGEGDEIELGDEFEASDESSES